VPTCRGRVPIDERGNARRRDAGTTRAVHLRILLYPGFDELDAIGPFEVLSMAVRRIAALRANDRPASSPWSVELASIDGAREIRASNGLRVGIDPAPMSGAPTEGPGGSAATAPRTSPDVLLVPGGGWVDRSRIGAWSEFERGDGAGTVAHEVRREIDRGAVVASVCTGAMLLARAGVLRGRRCITHHAAIDDLAAFGAVIVRARVVDDGNIVTAGGVTSGIDLALHLVSRFAGNDLADGIAATLEYERRAASIPTSGTRDR